MASGCLGDSKPCRTIREGLVQVIHGKHGNKKRYLKAVCGGNGGMPARLQVYEDAKSASKGKSSVWEILFTNVEYVDSTEERHKKVVTIGTAKNRKQFSFYVADSHTSTIKWFKYCGLLFAIPHYVIPEVPKENLDLQKNIDQCKDKPVNNWVVYILGEGIGDVTGITGLHVVTICDSTIDICDFHTDKPLLTWHRDSIRLSGCIESLVFLEVNEASYGGPGLLWMQHPMPQAMTLQQHLHDFVFEQHGSKRTTLARHILVDSAVSHMYFKSSNNSQSSYEEQYLNDASQSSLESHCSSGYWSDNSSWAGSHYGSFRFNHLKGTHVQLPKAERKQSKDECDTNKSKYLSPCAEMVYPTIDDDKVTKNSHENCNHSSYENVLLSLNSQKPPPLPPRTYKKTPLYENHQIPVPSGNVNVTSKCSNSFPSSEGSTCSHCTGRSMSSSCQPQAVPPAHQSESAVSGKESSNRSPLATTDTVSKHELEKIAFNKCSVKITQNLDIAVVLPHLNSYGLLTEKDRQTLLNNYLTDVEKANYLLDILPRKEHGFFETFIFCLCQSKDGTGHDDIVKALTTTMKEVKESKVPH